MANANSKDPQSHEGGNNIQNEKDRRYQAERVDMPEDKNSFMMSFRAESIFSWAEYIKVNRPTEEDEAPDDRPAEDLDRLSVAQDGKTAASRLKFDFDLPSAASDDMPLGEGIRLPEWHYKKQLMQPNHCRLQPMLARNAEPLALPAHLLSHGAPPAQSVRRADAFQGLVQGTVRRQRTRPGCLRSIQRGSHQR